MPGIMTAAACGWPLALQVVDEVDNLDAYRISLRGVGSCALAVKSLVYSNIAAGMAWALALR